MNAIQDRPMVASAESLRELLHTLLFTHYPSLRGALAGTNDLAERIACEHPVPPGIMDQFQRQYLAMADVLETYLARQECLLFPLFCELDTLGGEPHCIEDDLRVNLLEAMEESASDQKEVLDQVERARTRLCELEGADRGGLVCEMIDVMADMQEELGTCVDLEKELLFPEVRKWLGKTAGQ
jgi:iron-sulfur cluster repair protein YtfE (RIC family)